MQQTISMPAISIIIPTYNLERYIGEFFESLLSQTFQDFELIVIDDCSKDRTVEIIENYSRRFTQIQLIKRQKNFGYASTIRNVFATHANGKYILNADGDDILLPDALEKLFDAAEKFDADFVCTDGYFLLDETRKDEIKLKMCKGNHIESPTLEILDISERIRRFREDEVIKFHWNKLIRRDFLIRNRIEFPDMPICCDWAFSLQVILMANRFVRIPTIANIYRLRGDGNSQQRNQSGNIVFERHTKDLVVGTKFIEDFLNQIEFFQDNPEQIYDFIDYFITSYIKNFLTRYQVPGFFIESTLREVFSQNPQNNIPLLIHIFNLLKNQLE